MIKKGCQIVLAYFVWNIFAVYQGRSTPQKVALLVPRKLSNPRALKQVKAT